MDENTFTIGVPSLPPGTINDIFVTNPAADSRVPSPTAGSPTSSTSARAISSTRRSPGSSAEASPRESAAATTASTQHPAPADGRLPLKSKYGVCYTPPPCTGVFPDVPCPSTFANWIEALAAEGITGGCGGGNYCPANPVRRDQMAVFLLKAKHGSSYVPPPCSGDFADVACPSTFADWIEQLAAEGVTGGCGGGNDCPLNNVTAEQMAAFLVTHSVFRERAFGCPDYQMRTRTRERRLALVVLSSSFRRRWPRRTPTRSLPPPTPARGAAPGDPGREREPGRGHDRFQHRGRGRPDDHARDRAADDRRRR